VSGSTQPRQCVGLGRGGVESESLLLGHGEAKLKWLLLGHGGVFDLAMTVANRKAFYSFVAMPLTRHDEAEWECLLLGYDKAESKGLLLSWDGASDLAVTASS